MMDESDIQKYYEGGRVFITGGTGFLGNLLIQKLIRDCPGISKLYLLVRSKKGKSPENRLEELFKDSVFNKMKSEQPNYADKINLMCGDLEQPMLGLNEDDLRTLEQEVNLVFHVAATVRFDEKIKKAAAINIRATKDVIHIAKNMPNLRAYIHVSTAYSHCYRKEIGEEIYDVPMDPDRLLEITQQLSDEELEVLTPTWIGDWPNTYTYTKAMAEKMVEKYARDLPIGIVRPSIVISTSKDPEEGWVNNFYGPVSLSMAVAAGVMRVGYIEKNNICDFVPADYVINCIIAAGQKIGTSFKSKPRKDNVEFDELQNKIKIFNYVSSNENSITWGKYRELCFSVAYPYSIPSNIVWYPMLFLIPNIYMYTIVKIFLHTIPALIMDLAAFALGNKPSMLKLYQKLESYNVTTSYFAMNQWHIKNDNVQALWRELKTKDKSKFEFSMAALDWKEYFISFGKGFRIYLFKEPIETLPKAQEKYNMLTFAHYILVTSLILVSGFVLFQIKSYTL